MQTPTNRAAQNWVLGVTALASFMMALDAMIITTAFAAIRAEFGSPVETLQWTVNAFNLTFAVLLLTGAALGDRFGRRRMFAAGIALFVVASAACALAGNATALIAARALQGAGAALVMPLAMAILSGTFGREERARALGIFSSITGCALIIGPAIGGFITEHFGWRFVFWINLPIGLIAIALVLARLRESFGPAAALDIPGLALVALAALALVWSLLRGNAVGWASAEVMATLISGLVFTVGFVLWELRAAAPMVPMRLFASRALASGMSASVLFYAAMYGVLFLLPQFLQTALGFDAFGAGLRLLPWTATLFVTAPVRRLSRQQVRRAAAGGDGIADAGDRPRLDRRDRQPRGCLLRPGRAAGAGRNRRLDGDAGSAERHPELGRGGRNGQGVRNLQHGPLPRRHVRHRSPGGELLRPRRGLLGRAFRERICRGDAPCRNAVDGRRDCGAVPAGTATDRRRSRAARCVTPTTPEFRHRPGALCHPRLFDNETSF